MKIFMDYVKDIMRFYREEKGIPLDPEPKVVLDQTPHSRFDPFAPTGHYDFRDNTVTLYVSNRQCKDILRTLCHELVHVSQYQKEGRKYMSFNKSGDLVDNPTLRKYESEAFEKGNLYFRDWTEQARR